MALLSRLVAVFWFATAIVSPVHSSSAASATVVELSWDEPQRRRIEMRLDAQSGVASVHERRRRPDCVQAWERRCWDESSRQRRLPDAAVQRALVIASAHAMQRQWTPPAPGAAHYALVLSIPSRTVLYATVMPGNDVAGQEMAELQRLLDAP